MSVYGGAGFGKGLDESFIVSEGWAYQAPRNVEKVQKFKPRNAVFLTALRHPVTLSTFVVSAHTNQSARVGIEIFIFLVSSLVFVL